MEAEKGVRTSSAKATLAGFGAILLWGTLSVLTALTGKLPAFETTAITFAIAGLAGSIVAIARGRAALLKPTLASFLLGLYGFFAYHALYFAALALAPPAEGQLVASLYALLIVLFSALLPGSRLERRHVIGALIGLVAAGLLVSDRLGGGASPGALLGYVLAFSCAVVWASYSVASRLVSEVATESLGITCLATAGLAALCHLVFETTVIPGSPVVWAALVGLGLGPVGAAFFLWDIGMKKGNVPLLGVLGYAAPIISTGLLVIVGFAEPSIKLAAAVAMMVVGAIVATR
ncbi:MAG: EamA family transporter [Beijerinckiaceae bacterium]|nr:EamA family transporter [Beijerinckiaceae bacterium]